VTPSCYKLLEIERTAKEVVMVVDRSGIHRAKKLASTLAHYDGQLQFPLLPARCGHHLNPMEGHGSS
jgi:hypothetical protein